MLHNRTVRRRCVLEAALGVRIMQKRRAFTIVEMLVSLALIILIMVVLSEAYSIGLTTFRDLKAIGDMEERLRTVSTLMRSDLTADHFDGRRRLSDPQFWVQGPPTQGYFRIWWGGPYLAAPITGVQPQRNTNEPPDGDGLASYFA